MLDEVFPRREDVGFICYRGILGSHRAVQYYKSIIGFISLRSEVLSGELKHVDMSSRNRRRLLKDTNTQRGIDLKCVLQELLHLGPVCLGKRRQYRYGCVLA